MRSRVCSRCWQYGDTPLHCACDNGELDCTKLKKEFPELLSIKDSLVKFVYEGQTKLEPGAYQPPAKANPAKAKDPEVPLAPFAREDGKSVFLLLGGNGWLGGILKGLLSKGGEQYHVSKCRLQDRSGLLAEIEEYKPTHILNAAGVTGRPNVDWCETHRVATLRTNVIGVLTLADICEMKGIHMTNFATGCIFEYDTAHPIGGPGFTEEDRANFDGSFYSFTKARAREREERQRAEAAASRSDC